MDGRTSPSKRGSSRGRANGINARGRPPSNRGSSAFGRKTRGTPLFQAATASDSEEASDNDVADPTLHSQSKLRDASTFDPDAEAARRSRFGTHASANRYIELKPLREKERHDAVTSGLIPDPLKPRRLDEAITFQGTCQDMCPEFEREEREYQKNVDRWELAPGSNRIDPSLAVKAFHRPAAGNEQPLPSDVRPPSVLKATLDYLFHDILARDPLLRESHPFLRDRTRAVRQDFTMQNERGALAIECHERIARYHILCLHILREWENFSESQELEQLRKVLQSLNEFYDDARHEGISCPYEAEFRAYYLITHLRDWDTVRQVELLPPDLFDSKHMQAALRIHALAQRNNESRGERGRRPANSEASLNAFSRLFRAVASDETSYLLACLVESHFVDIRRGALVSLKKSFIHSQPDYPITKLTKLLGCDDGEHCQEVAEGFGLNVKTGGTGVPISVELHKKVEMIEYPPTVKQRASKTIVEAKRGKATYQSVIDGKFYSAHVNLPSPSTQKRPSSVKAASPTVSRQTSFLGTAPAKTAILSPPISAPTTPGVGASPSKPLSFVPTSKLNAGATSFTPTNFGSKPKTPVRPAFPSIPPPQLPPAIVSVAPRVGSPTQAKLSPDNSSHLEVAAPSKLVPVIAHQCTQSRPSTQAQPAPSGSALPLAVKPNTASAYTKEQLDQIPSFLFGKLVKQYVSKASKQVLKDAILNSAQQRESERRLAVEQCSAELMTAVLQRFSQIAAAEMAVEQKAARRQLRSRMHTWQKSLERARRARAIQEKRRQQFKELAHELDVSPKKGPKRDSYSLPDVSILDIADVGKPRAGMKKATDTPAESPFWQEGTLSSLICDTVDRTFSTFGYHEPIDWKAIFVVPSHDSPIAAWTRCKLGLPPKESARILARRYVRVEYAVMEASELEDELLHDVGLVVLNADHHVHDDGMTALKKRLVEDSIFSAFLLQADWVAGLPTLEGFIPLQIDASTLNGSLDAKLHNNLAAIRQNSKRKLPPLAKEHVAKFTEEWNTAFQRACVVQSSGVATVFVKQFVGALQILQDVLSPHLESDSDILQVPAFRINAGDSIVKAISSYLLPLVERDISLAYFRTSLRNESFIGSDYVVAQAFLRHLSAAVSASYADVQLHRKWAQASIDESLEQYKEEVDDAVHAIISASKEAERANGRKRCRTSSANDVSSTSTTQVKRVKEDAALLPKYPESYWLPNKISSLSDLINETKSLLENK